MTSMDKAAIGWSIAIVAAGVAIAFAGQSGQDLSMDVNIPAAPSAMPSPTVEPKTSDTPKDPFADIAAKVKEEPKEMMKDIEKSTTKAAEVVEEVTEEVGEAVKEVTEEVGEAVKEEVEKMAPGPKTISVSMPAGTSVPGCEETDECYIPASVTIFAGDTVSWINDDTAAHTVTSGSPAEGPSGVFDSSLVMGGAVFEHTFDDAGSYDYFCMVHPWMIGNVQVN